MFIEFHRQFIPRGFLGRLLILVQVRNLNRNLLQWAGEFYTLLRTVSFKMLTWFMESKDCSSCRYFSPDFFPGMPGRRNRVIWSTVSNPAKSSSTSWVCFGPVLLASIYEQSYLYTIRLKIHKILRLWSSHAPAFDELHKHLSVS